MIAAMRNRGDAAIIGWGFDGYPIFGNNNPDGTSISAGQLDVCNGQSDPVYGYRYHTSDAPPYVLQCLTGAVDVAMAPRVAPLTQQGGGGRPPGEKPPGGVTNLQLVESPDGSRRMSYTHQGQTYYIAYRPSSTANCWDFDESTFTTRGVQRLGTYCRGPR